VQDWPIERFASRLLAVLKDRRIAWSIVVVEAARLLVINFVTTARPDAASFLGAGREWLNHPSHLYDAATAYIATNHISPAQGVIGPPGAALLATPFSLLPSPWDVVGWTVADCVCVLLALFLLDRMLRLSGALRAWYWVVALYFPPLFAETIASQIGGYLMLLGCASIVLVGRRPGWAGVLAAVGCDIKLYPISLVLGAGPRRLRAFVGGVAGGGLLLGALTFGPIGWNSPVHYVRDVLLPALGSHFADCQVVSVFSFWDRLIGGASYPTLASGHETWMQIGPDIPGLAEGLGVASVVGIVVMCVAAARRSGWHPVYSPAIAFSLGALLPGELRTYQVLPLLPLVLIVLVTALRAGDARVVIGIALGLLGVVVQPCSLVFPNLWTVAIVWLFVVCASQARRYAKALPAALSPATAPSSAPGDEASSLTLPA
jgi:hypothetical protein